MHYVNKVHFGQCENGEYMEKVGKKLITCLSVSTQ